jgi:hypothetical protein
LINKAIFTSEMTEHNLVTHLERVFQVRYDLTNFAVRNPHKGKWFLTNRDGVSNGSSPIVFEYSGCDCLKAPRKPSNQTIRLMKASGRIAFIAYTRFQVQDRRKPSMLGESQDPSARRSHNVSPLQLPRLCHPAQVGFTTASSSSPRRSDCVRIRALTAEVSLGCRAVSSPITHPFALSDTIP